MTNGELLAAVRAWAAANYPGCPLEHITIHLRYLSVPIQLADVPGFAVTQPSARQVFIPNAFQAAILDALEGKAMRTDALGLAVGDRRRIFKKPGGLSELKDNGLVAHHSRLGFYRPDAPPELAGE